MLEVHLCKAHGVFKVNQTQPEGSIHACHATLDTRVDIRWNPPDHRTFMLQILI